MTRTSTAPSKASLRVVVADDDLDSVVTLMMLLRDEGHEVRGVPSAGEVVRVVNEFQPDVVLLDIAMPGQSGWELARRIRARPARRPKLIALSGQYKDGDMILAEIVGFDHYVLKPYEPAALLRLLA